MYLAHIDQAWTNGALYSGETAAKCAETQRLWCRFSGAGAGRSEEGGVAVTVTAGGAGCPGRAERPGRGVLRLLGIRVAWGVVLVAAPRPLLRAVAGRDDPGDRIAVVVLRVLGARHLAQAALEGLGPQPVLRYLGTAVDGLHALTALGLAVLDPRWRRAALTDSAVATAFAAATAAVLRAGRRGRA
jgi:hypothetical protein